MTSKQQKPSTSLPPRVLQVVGLGGLVLQLVFWMATAILAPPGFSNPLLLTSFGALASIGLGLEAFLEALRTGRREG